MGVELIKIDKRKARSMFNSGYAIVVVPCKCRPDNTVCRARLRAMLCNYASFDDQINNFAYYNCCKELGCRVTCYVEAEDLHAYMFDKLKEAQIHT